MPPSTAILANAVCSVTTIPSLLARPATLHKTGFGMASWELHGKPDNLVKA